MKALFLLVSLVWPAGAGAAPQPQLLPDGTLVLAQEGARYSVTPDRRVVPVQGTLSFFRQEERPLRPVVEQPAWVYQGHAVTVLLASVDPLDSVTAVLRSPDGYASTRTRAFEVPYIAPPAGPPAFPPPAVTAAPRPQAARARAYAVIVGVPAEASLGAWRIEIQGASGDRTFSYAGRLDVFSGGYPESRVRLTQGLTELRTRSDDRTARDQARLDAAIRSFTTDEPAVLASWAAPARGVQSAGFGDRRVYVYSDGSTARTIHRGMDLALPTGTPVLATSGGKVVLAEELLVTGKTVGIESFPGVVTLFFHLSSIHVRMGDRVERGQIVGRVGATGLATGAHLHWELRVSQVAVDPGSGGSLVDKRAVFRIIAACESQNRQRR